MRLSDAERERLNRLIHKGKHRAGQLVKARILVKADASESGEGNAMTTTFDRFDA